MLLQHYNYLNLSFQSLPVYAPYFNLFYNLLSHPTPPIMLLKFKFIFLSSSGSYSQGPTDYIKNKKNMQCHDRVLGNLFLYFGLKFSSL